jgi:hypothetical protein
MLNKYNDLYAELLDKFAKLHNANVLFKQRMNYKNAKDLRLTCVDFQEHVDVLKREILSIQRRYREEVLQVRKKRRELKKGNQK